MFFFTAAAAVALFTHATHATQCSRNYTVVEGDICDRISAQNNVSTYQLLALNFPAINTGCSNLQPGENLCLGVVGEDCTTTYTVQSDDTCSDIASAANVNITILTLNNPQLSGTCAIYVGEVLCVAQTVLVPPAPAGFPSILPSDTLPTASGASGSVPPISSSFAIAAVLTTPVLRPVSTSVFESTPILTPASKPTKTVDARPSVKSSTSNDVDDIDDDQLPFCDE